MVDQQAQAASPAAPIQAESSAYAIEFEEVNFAYGAKPALKNIGFGIRKGSFTALLGANGAGKTTIFALLTRLIVPQSGQIRLLGADLAKQPRQALAHVGVVFQQQTLDLDLSVIENLTYYAALRGLPRSQVADSIEHYLSLLDLSPRRKDIVRNLNGGHRRRLEIVRALIHQPKILLLDEPTSGLDFASRQAIVALLHQQSRDHGLTILWTTHIADEIQADDDLLILHQGGLIASGAYSDLVGPHESLADSQQRLIAEAGLAPLPLSSPLISNVQAGVQAGGS